MSTNTRKRRMYSETIHTKLLQFDMTKKNDPHSSVRFHSLHRNERIWFSRKIVDSLSELNWWLARWGFGSLTWLHATVMFSTELLWSKKTKSDLICPEQIHQVWIQTRVLTQLQTTKLQHQIWCAALGWLDKTTTKITSKQGSNGTIQQDNVTLAS